MLGPNLKLYDSDEAIDWIRYYSETVVFDNGSGQAVYIVHEPSDGVFWDGNMDNLRVRAVPVAKDGEPVYGGTTIEVCPLDLEVRVPSCAFVNSADGGVRRMQRRDVRQWKRAITGDNMQTTSDIHGVREVARSLRAGTLLSPRGLGMAITARPRRLHDAVALFADPSIYARCVGDKSYVCLSTTHPHSLDWVFGGNTIIAYVHLDRGDRFEVEVVNPFYEGYIAKWSS